LPHAPKFACAAAGGRVVFCSKCGSTLENTASFCSKCGQPTHGAAMVAVGNAPLAAPSGAALAIPVAAPNLAPGSPARAYAGFWLRFLAYIIDAMILSVFAFPILIGAGMAMGVGTAITSLPRNRDPFETGFPPVFIGFFSMIVLVAILGTWLYHALLESSEWQATAGKKILGLEVTDLAGARVSFARASGRHFAKIITGVVPLAIGYIMAGFTEKRQALHDMLASCLVLRKT
jgi:uncharacterized RDD family membrane protein YckC